MEAYSVGVVKLGIYYLNVIDFIEDKMLIVKVHSMIRIGIWLNMISINSDFVDSINREVKIKFIYRLLYFYYLPLFCGFYAKIKDINA